MELGDFTGTSDRRLGKLWEGCEMNKTFWYWLSWMEEIGPCWPDCNELVSLALYLTD
jgi:hypothetical protein